MAAAAQARPVSQDKFVVMVPVPKVEKKSPETGVAVLSSPVAERQQLLGSFLHARFPYKNPGKVMSYLEMLPNMDLSSPLLSNAVTTLGLAHVAAESGDHRLVQASQATYGRVLSTLMHAIGQPDRKVPFSHREIIASILLMGLYDESTPKQCPVHNGYMTHFMGAEQYVEAFGPSCLDLDNKFDFKLMQFLRMTSFCTGVANRRRVTWSRPEWRAAEKKAFEEGPKVWYPLIVPLPGLLERADELLARPWLATQHPDRLVKLCAEFLEWERGLLGWADRRMTEYPQKLHITDLEAFNPDIEEHCFLTTSNLFPFFHTFHEPGSAMEVTQSWMYCLIAKCTLLRLLRRIPATAAILNMSAASVEAAATQLALDLCRSVHAYSALKSLGQAHWLRVYLNAVRVFFEQRGSWKEYGWCQACLIATKLRIERRARSERPSLCRVETLLPGFAEAMRFQSVHYPALVDD